MKDDRLRIPLEENYARALGRAAYVFNIMEYNAAWCCQACGLPKYVEELGKKTAGDIARHLVTRAPNYPDASRQADLAKAAAEFQRLVGKRNDLLHARGATAPDGAQRLDRHGALWTSEMIDDVADEFAACAITLRSFVIV